MAGLFFSFFFPLIITFIVHPSPITSQPLTTYIVQIRQPENMAFTTAEERGNWYASLLHSLNGSDRMVCSYKNVMSGFAARLTEEEVKALERMDGFISAEPDTMLQLHTTATPAFLGLRPDMGTWKDSNFGRGVIIGVLDTGIAPDHPSFSDKGMPPPPPKWRGRCEFSTCNNKIIGARSFLAGTNAMLGQEKIFNQVMSPLDTNGHGTHTAGTAAGTFVPNANVLGNAPGTAAGIAPMAHLAIYKVCSASNCSTSDILQGMDSAIEDGVDILSLSLGRPGGAPFFNNPVDNGAFNVMERGILVSCSAGNNGPDLGTVSNSAPWVLTVGASTIDRSISAVVKLGNGQEFIGESLFQPQNSSSALMPIVYPGANGQLRAATCLPEALNATIVRGKVVLCDVGVIGRVLKGQAVRNAGGAAMILTNRERQGYSISAENHVLPASHISYLDGLKIKSYINSTSNPTATITFSGTLLGRTPAPAVAHFSSRGPNLASFGILKPDIIGPGANILAAWPRAIRPSQSNPPFNIISGTSMSCPHLSGIAALLKSAHPDWSPAMIKSAIMTSADILDHSGNPIVDETHNPADLFAVGAGHVNPPKAAHPGLVYDIQPDEYLRYLCGLNYSNAQVSSIAGRPIQCSVVGSLAQEDLNYPSFSVILEPSGTVNRTVNRTVTNVGEASSSYTVRVLKPNGVEVNVNPSTLSFSEVNQRLTFSVSFSRNSTARPVPSGVAEGSLTWVSSSKYAVRSPISVIFLS